MQLNLSINKSLLMIMLFFPISTVLQGINIFENINKALIFVLIVLMLAQLLSKRIAMKSMWMLISGMVLSLIAILLTGKPYFINTFIYYPFWVIFFVYLYENYELLMQCAAKNTLLIGVAVYLWEALVFISLFFEVSYSNSWEDRYFLSFSGSEHRFASACLEIMAIIVLYTLMKRMNRLLLLEILPLAGLFMCGARTYLVIGAVFAIAIFYVFCKSKTLFWLSVIPLGVIIVLLILVTPVGNKFVNAFKGDGYYGYWATLTSGRSMFWVEDITGYWKLPFWKKLVGNGANFIYDLNLAGMSKKLIYAHNDYINLLCSNGLLGLILYGVVFVEFLKKTKRKRAIDKGVPLFCFYFICIFNAFFNMLYTYPNAVLAVPFIYYVLYSVDQEKFLRGDE